MIQNTKKRILIISRTAWRNDNSFGNSFSNIFGGIEEFKIGNIYCGSGLPDTEIVSDFFQINEKLLLKNLYNKKFPSGRIVYSEQTTFINKTDSTSRDKKIFQFFQKNRWHLFFFLREMIWFFGRWRSKELKRFIDDFNPDLIFLPVYYWPYMNNMGLFVKKYSKKNMVGYISDDNYTLKHISYNPLFWIERLFYRRFVKKAVDNLKLLYVISEIQKIDYDKAFNINTKLLFKGGDFNGDAKIRETLNTPISLLFTGNIGAGRYKSLALIGSALDSINKNGIKAELSIYTLTPITSKMKNLLESKNSIKIKGSLSFDEVKNKQRDSDILVHVESFDLKEKLLVRQSFSTKIVDYLQMARCIFAVGDKETASINYLIKNDAGIIATNENEIEEKLKDIINNEKKLKEYGEKTWLCGKRNHDLKKIQKGLIKDFESILNSKEQNSSN